MRTVAVFIILIAMDTPLLVLILDREASVILSYAVVISRIC